MITLAEQIVWILLAANCLAAGFISFRMYRTLPIQPYIYQSLALFSFGIFGIFAFLGQTQSTMVYLQTSGILFGLAILFYFKFFLVLFGHKRHYDLLYLFCWILFGFSIHGIVWCPPTLVETQIIANTRMVFSFLSIVLLFMAVLFDYLMFSLRKIRKDHLPRRLAYFSITILTSMIITLIPMILLFFGLIPLYGLFLFQIVFVSSILYQLVKYPHTNFLALVEPQFLTVIHHSGLKVYAHQFKAVEQEELLTGAISAINSLFNETVTQANFERIIFRGKNIYAAHRDTFSVVYIDDEYIPYIAKVLNELADKIETKYSEKFTKWSGDMIGFDAMEQDVKECLYFLPQFIKILT